MCNRNVIKEKALEKLGKLLKEALQYYENSSDIKSLCVIVPDRYFSDLEYKEVEHNIGQINTSPYKFLEYCIYSGVEIPQTLHELIIDQNEEDCSTSGRWYI